MKFLKKLLQEKAMAETMRDNKGTINPDTNQYHLVVFLATGSGHIIIYYQPYPVK